MMYSYYASQSLDIWAVFAWLVAIGAVYAVFRLWRGMRLDPFERSIRRLREQSNGRLTFASKDNYTTRHPAGSFRLFQFRLLPLMVSATCASMLLAQAARPDDTSRVFTWALFLVIGTWYGTRWWTYRGIGPLRNHAWGGVVSGVVVSAFIWGYYLGVDVWHGDPAYGRIQSSTGVLLWWSAVGSVVGGLIGFMRAARLYNQTSLRIEPRELASDLIDGLANCGVVAESPRGPWQRLPRQSTANRWGFVTVGCLASLLFHLSVAPHAHQVFHYRYWNWYWERDFRWQPSLTLTMAASDTPNSNSTDLDLLFAQEAYSYDPPSVVRLNADGDAEHHDEDEPLNFNDNTADARPNVMQSPKVKLYNGPIPYVVGTGYPAGYVALNRDVSKGELITSSMIVALRSEGSSQRGAKGGLLDASLVAGKFAAADIRAQTPIMSGDLTTTPTPPAVPIVTLRHTTIQTPAGPEKALYAEVQTPEGVLRGRVHSHTAKQLQLEIDGRIVTIYSQASARGDSRAAPEQSWNQPFRQLSEPGPGVVGPGPGALTGQLVVNGDDEPTVGPNDVRDPPLRPIDDPIRYEQFIGEQVTVEINNNIGTTGTLVALVQPNSKVQTIVLHTQTGRVDIPVMEITNIWRSVSLPKLIPKSQPRVKR